MIEPTDIENLRTAAPDYHETERLKQAFRRYRQQRSPFFLTAAEMDQVFRWKLGAQYQRVKRHLVENAADTYRIVTSAVFQIEMDIVDHELEVRVKLLCVLRGVGVPVASAVLALTDPDRYCVIDFRGWRAVIGEMKHDFSVADYCRYRNAVAELGQRLGWPVQEVDLAIWEYDRRRGDQ